MQTKEWTYTSNILSDPGHIGACGSAGEGRIAGSLDDLVWLEGKGQDIAGGVDRGRDWNHRPTEREADLLLEGVSDLRVGDKEKSCITLPST